MAKSDNAILTEVADMCNRGFAPAGFKNNGWRKQFKPGDRVEILRLGHAVETLGVIRNAGSFGWIVDTDEGVEVYAAPYMIRARK